MQPCNRKQSQKRGKDMGKLKVLLSLLIEGTPLPAAYIDHPLKGGWKGFRDAHQARIARRWGPPARWSTRCATQLFALSLLSLIKCLGRLPRDKAHQDGGVNPEALGHGVGF